MHLHSIQIAARRTVDVAGRAVETGIFKEPVGEAQVERLGLRGDAIVNTKHHGGPDQAVYVYSAEDYAWWESELGRDLVPGLFGENLTLSTFGSAEVMIGDRWQIGEVVLETTAPRIPCATFGAKMNDAAWPEQFRAARRPGFYARVVDPGWLATGMTAEREAAESGLSLLGLLDLTFDREAPAARIAAALEAPVAERDRNALQQRLARLG